MDGEETYDGEDCVSAGHPLELSQSSGVMSLPSGNKLAEISITSDITDSEIENEDAVLGSHTYHGLKKNLQCNTEREKPDSAANAELCFSEFTTQCAVTDKRYNNGKSGTENGAVENIHTDKFLTNMTDSNSYADDANRKLVSDVLYSTVPLHKYDEVPVMPNLSLDDVRFALQENCNLLSDHHLLNDLLKSLDEKINQDSTIDSPSCIFSAQKYSHSFVPPNRDPGPSLGRKFKTNVDTLEIGAAVSEASDLPLTCDSFCVQNFNTSASDIPSQRLLTSGFSTGPQESVRPRTDRGIQNGRNNFIKDAEQMNNSLLVSSIPEKVAISNIQEESVDEKSSERHVKFNQVPDEDLVSSDLSKVDKLTSQQQYCENHIESLPCSAQSHKILKQLSGLRWRLLGWEEVGTRPPTDNRSSLAFIHQLLNILQVHQVEKKDNSLNILGNRLGRFLQQSWACFTHLCLKDFKLPLLARGMYICQMSPQPNLHAEMLTRLSSSEITEHLEDELQTAKSMLRKVSDEAFIRQSLYEKREVRLMEADTHLSVIQKEWVGAQEIMQKEIMRLSARCNQLMEEKEFLKEKCNSMKKEMTKLKLTAKDYEKLKVTIKEIQDQCSASKKQAAEITRENLRLNHCLQEMQKSLQELEEVKLPQVQQELKIYKNKAKGLEEAHDKLFQTKALLEDDLRMLREQHKVLLEKVVEEEEMKEKLLKEKVLLEDHVKNLSAQVIATRTELHQHYQAQVEDLVGKKSQSLQEQLSKLELNMNKTLEEQLDAQRKSHHHACLNLQKGHEKKIREVESCHAMQILKLQHHLKLVEEENRRLQDQRQGIITAVSSILGIHHEDIISAQNTSKVLGRENHEVQLNSMRSKVSSRPTSGGNLSRGKSSSKNGSRPTSGKSTRDVPHLSLKSTSSSDSELSVFQDGGQTVRYLGVGSLDNVFFGNSLFENDDNVKPINSRSKNVTGILGSDYPAMISHVSNSEREYRSLPNLQSKSSVHDNHHSDSGTVGVQQSHMNHPTGANNELRVHYACDNAKANHKNKGHHQDPLLSLHPFLTKKIFKASEILQASDNTDDDGGELPAYNKFEADQEMAMILKELNMVKNNAKTSDSAGPTHDTFDQDPASITLHKLSQVSTLLSQYVTQSQ
ncbi:uncharacterized protein [Panulirus ornatus]|uniref:uncharacterized protein isoform X2 n=1 Tax=Panulirus ornatus TaxID=150431 RepID=UPI003A888277